MKRVILTIMLGLIGLLPISLWASNAYAVDVISPVCSTPRQPGSPVPTICQGTDTGPTAKNPIYTVLTVVIDILSAVVGVGSVIVIIVQGLRIVLSNGDSNTVENARNAIIYACVGVIFAIFAQIFVAFVLDRFTT